MDRHLALTVSTFFGEMNVIRSLIAWNMPYCKHCGQKLDWSDEE